jgi:hypothetical protein
MLRHRIATMPVHRQASAVFFALSPYDKQPFWLGRGQDRHTKHCAVQTPDKPSLIAKSVLYTTSGA